jgi:hypothetical protein
MLRDEWFFLFYIYMNEKKKLSCTVRLFLGESNSNSTIDNRHIIALD